MKKKVFLLLFLVAIIGSVAAQQNSLTMVRHGGHLRYEGSLENIDKQNLSIILDENAISNYMLARREYIAAGYNQHKLSITPSSNSVGIGLTFSF